MPCSGSVTPMESTRTSSPYFSPNRAMAPASIASSGDIRRVETSALPRICAFTSASTAAICCGVRASGCEKSKRRRSSATRLPFWVTCAPSRLAQRRVQQVRGAVIGADAAAPAMIDREMDHVADRNRAALDRRLMDVQAAQRLGRVLDLRDEAVRADRRRRRPSGRRFRRRRASGW